METDFLNCLLCTTNSGTIQSLHLFCSHVYSTNKFYNDYWNDYKRIESPIHLNFEIYTQNSVYVGQYAYPLIT